MISHTLVYFLGMATIPGACWAWPTLKAKFGAGVPTQ